MAYRQLTNDEIIQLGQELTDLRAWEGARDYVSALYGLEARSPTLHKPHQVTISITSERTNRMDVFSYRENVTIAVTDRQSHVIPYDVSRYWWSQFTLSAEAVQALSQDISGKLDLVSSLDDGTLYSALKDFCMEKLGIEFIEYRQPHDPLTFTYLIDTLPSISYPAVYVDE